LCRWCQKSRRRRLKIKICQLSLVDEVNMAEENGGIVKLHDDFYRDGFEKVVLAISGIVLSLLVLVGISIYLHVVKPGAVIFPTQDEWRILPPVPVDQAYLTDAEVLQWVGTTMPKLFNFEFNKYNTQLASYRHYFTDDGWKVFLNQLNIYVNYNTVQDSKLFVSAAPGLAPYVVQQGMLTGRHAWLVQMPIDINYSNQKKSWTDSITLQVLIVRTPTIDSLTGVAIDNVIVLGGQANNASVGSS
jgi:intracellular multiplication protein IcmL